MLKIGEFAKLSRLSVKTLRYYDKIGLLRPNGVDESNGYRYYTEAQLLTVKRIAAFKEQGFKLEQIIPFLEEGLTPDRAVTRLLDKQEELRRLIEESEQQLEAIGEKLRRAAKAADVHETERPIAVRPVEPVLAASIRETVPLSRLCLLLDEVSRYVRGHGEPEPTTLIVLKHSRQAEGEPVDLEVAVPVAKPTMPSSDRVRVGLLPGLSSAASLVHRCDPYRDGCTAAETVSSWIAAHGYARDEGAPTREVYMTPDQDIYGRERLTELLVPVASVE